MGCIVIDENILISISYYNKELDGAINRLNTLFDLMGLELCTYESRASQCLANLKLIENDNQFKAYTEDHPELFMEIFSKPKISLLFKDDEDKENDLLLIAYAYWRAKIKNEKCILLTREKRIWKACQLIGISCCCLLHVLECVVNEFGFEDFRKLLTHLQNHTQLIHPNWAYEHSIDCKLLE